MESIELARAATDRGEIVLRQRDEGGVAIVELRVNGVFVMDTHETSSETALATHALAAVPEPGHVLVGGLGLGFTAHALLGDRRVEQVDVVEIEQPLIDWMRDGTVPHGPGLIADDRLRLICADIRQAIHEAPDATYDLVLLDVDNGPGHLVLDANVEVYEAPFLAEMVRTVRRGGVIAIWSADPAPALLRMLDAVTTSAGEEAIPVELQGRAEHYYMYVGHV